MTPPLTNAMDIFVVANDARFLFKKLRRSPEAEQLATSCTTEELLNWLTEHAHTPPKTVEEAVQTYLHLVALYLQGDVALDGLKPSHVPQVQWGSRFVELMREATTPTSTSRVTIDLYKLVGPTQRQESPIFCDSTYAKLTPRH